LLLALAFASLARPAGAQTVPPVPSAELPKPAMTDSVVHVASAPEGPPAPLHPHWALVLSGGAARGIAHIGVLRALEEEPTDAPSFLDHPVSPGHRGV